MSEPKAGFIKQVTFMIVVESMEVFNLIFRFSEKATNITPSVSESAGGISSSEIVPSVFRILLGTEI